MHRAFYGSHPAWCWADGSRQAVPSPMGRVLKERWSASRCMADLRQERADKINKARRRSWQGMWPGSAEG